ncbi:MAG: hypothetical protein KatS3mg023_3819 [Armatimonadota bacterium]|nr:MAG: hypothetical protein KatS3mg023_3819 [Armatimonadota bacterium]
MFSALSLGLKIAVFLASIKLVGSEGSTTIKGLRLGGKEYELHLTAKRVK